MTTDPITSCDREPIHIPGSVQSYGALLVADINSKIVSQASANCGAVLGTQDQDLLGKTLEQIVALHPGSAPNALLGDARTPSDTDARWSRVSAQRGGQALDAIVHRRGDALLVELERAGPHDEVTSLTAQDFLQDAIAQLYRAPSVLALCAAATQAVQTISQFERVMVYRFDDHWNGEVIGETLATGTLLESYMGHHFPASDIPSQARAVFEKNWLRIIPDVNAAPVPLVPLLNPHTGAPLDMGRTLLRSAAPIHLEYLRNMGVGASLTLSLLRNGRLWGIVACHHATARYLPYSVRSACEQIGRIASALLFPKGEQEEVSLRASLRQTHQALAHKLRSADDVGHALTRSSPNLLDLAVAGGAAARIDGRWLLVGRVPTLDQLESLLRWLNSEHPDVEVLHTTCLKAVYPTAEAFTDVASGLLAMSLPQTDDNYLLWFRPEVLRTHTWAGNPEKGYVVEADRTVRVHPRQSFAAWREIVRGTSEAWRPAELEIVDELRKSVMTVDLARQFRNERAARAATEAERGRFAHLADASALLSSSLDIDDCLRRFAHLLTDTLCDWCVIYLRHDGAWRRAQLAHSTEQGQHILDGLRDLPGLETTANSFVQGVFENAKSIFEARVTPAFLRTLSPSEAYTQLVQNQLGVESLIVVPMCTRGECVGVLKLVRMQRTNRYHEDDVRLATELARRAAHAVENARLYRDASEALQARDHVLGVVSHDLRTPLGSIQLSAQGLLRKSKKMSHDVQTTFDVPLDRILKACRRMQGLIEDVLNLGKMESGSYVIDREQVLLQAVMDEQHNMIEPLAAAKSVKLLSRNAFPDVTFTCDPERLMQVFSNLVGNAIKFTPAGGTVTVSVSSCTAQEVTFEVSDTGPGIAPEDIPRIFDRYWQATRASRQGAGLGLFIARGIVEAHHGRMEVDSALQQGTTFRVHLPR